MSKHTMNNKHQMELNAIRLKNFFVRKINQHDTIYGKKFNKDVYFISHEFYFNKEATSKDAIEQITKLFDGTIYKLVQKWNGIIIELCPYEEKWGNVIYFYWENERWANKFLDELVSIMIINKILS